MSTRISTSAAIFAISFALAACGDDDESPKVEETPATLSCPGGGEFPFDLAVGDGSYNDTLVGATFEGSDYDKTEYHDVFAHPGDAVTISGSLGYSNTGLTRTAFGGETVSVWFHDGASWNSAGSATTSEDGSWEVPMTTALGEGAHSVYTVFEAARRCYAHNVVLEPAGTQFILTDVDGTMTAGDSELFAELGDASYDQEFKEGALDLVTTWEEKGYGIIYLTARPVDYRAMTDAWFVRHGMPRGLTMLSPELVGGDTAAAYKGGFVADVLDLGWDIVAAYGNADSDIAGYADGGIPAATTYIIGEHAGESGTVAIEDDSYLAHIAAVVDVQPDATTPE